MRMPLSVLTCLFLFILFLPYGSSLANGGISVAWRFDYADTACDIVLEAAANCSLCHTTAPEKNPYGQEIVDAGIGWFVIEPLDSDGDGRTNWEEISNDCTLPGDATSPTESTSWSRIKAIYSR